MNKRNFQNKDKNRKYKEKPIKPTPRTPTTTNQCKICYQQFNLHESFDKTQCNTCYNALFYYLYINMHLFV